MSENKLPSYEELFGNLDYSSADEYRSVLSPGAYLTDIMDLKNWKYDHDAIDEKDVVDDRREDISEILLNAENTITEIPHLDIVNQIMENRVRTINAGVDPYSSLNAAKFPFNLPFNRYKTEISNILEYFKTDPVTFYKSFTASPQTNIEAREGLGLSAEEYQEFITPVIDADVLKEYYGLKADETLDDLLSVTRFRKAAELSALQVTELFFQNLSDEERDAGVSLRFFINQSTSVNAYLVINVVNVDENEEERIFLRTVSTDGTVTDVVPSNDYFDRINRFIRLSRKTDLSFADLDLVLIKACGSVLDENALQIISVVAWLQQT
ncbi:MAG: Tc toxin subunit A, partial [Gammaproteobacteria bacterium]